MNLEDWNNGLGPTPEFLHENEIDFMPMNTAIKMRFESFHHAIR